MYYMYENKNFHNDFNLDFQQNQSIYPITKAETLTNNSWSLIQYMMLNNEEARKDLKINWNLHNQ